MTYEIELKAYINDFENIEQRAAQIGMFVKETFKEDVYFRRQGDNNILPIDRYRLRREGGQATVTFKEQMEAVGLEVNREIEFVVDDAHAFYQFAHRFGFEPFVVKRKKSRVYQVGRAHIELNKVEHVGNFAEIEILCQAESDIPSARIEIGQLLLRLGLTENELEPRRYIELIQKAYPVTYQFIDDSTLDWPFLEQNREVLK